jgi:carboxyl-terminal processing protease
MLPDSSMIRLTTARYYTPSGRCIQKSYEKGTEDYFSEIFARYEHGEMIHSDSIKFPDSLRYFTHNKRVVYGGGGIMPDVFISLDTSFMSQYYTDVFRKGLLNDYVMQYIEARRKELLAAYPDVKSYIEKFSEPDLINQFADFAATKEVPRDEKGLATSGTQIEIVLKGLIARNLYNVNAYFEVVGTTDDDIREAVKLIQNDNNFRKLTFLK